MGDTEDRAVDDPPELQLQRRDDDSAVGRRSKDVDEQAPGADTDDDAGDHTSDGAPDTLGLRRLIEFLRNP